MKKAGVQKPLAILTKDLKMNHIEEQRVLFELLALQKEAINGFRYINEKVKFSALNVFLLQGITQCKAFWEEINQLILSQTEETTILKPITEKKSDAGRKLQTGIAGETMIGLIEKIKLFEEYTISYYQRILEETLPENTKIILKSHLEALHGRYHRLKVLERKIKAD